jgi:tetratricopeptide (TPR) repeat protein
MARRVAFLSLLLVMLCSVVAAQMPGANTVDLHVRVYYSNEQKAGTLIRVELLGVSGVSIGEHFCDSVGQVDFPALPVGNYRLRITGMNIVDTTTDSFALFRGETSHMESVHVELKPNKDDSPGGSPAAGMVAAVDLNVPDKAKKEFDKGNEALAQNDLPQAKKCFDKAIQIYPQYAGAYNNLGIIAIRSKDMQTARTDFETAVRINDHYATAYANLARLSFAEHKYPDADGLLSKALVSAPLDPLLLTLLSEAQLLEGRYDDAVATAAKVHSSPHPDYAVVHIYAGLALLREHRAKEAEEQYATYLKEDPNGSKAPQVRAALAKLQQQGP